MMSQADKDLHSIALTLRDILKELKRFNKNYELIHTTQYGPTMTMDRTGVMLLSKEDLDGESGSGD